jgi:alanine racemase
MHLSLQDIAKIVDGEIILSNHPASCEHLAYDSRIINAAGSTLFFAIRGKNHDGHAYLRDCYQKGVRNFIVEDTLSLGSLSQEAKSQVNVIQVDDSVKAMQLLAAHHRRLFDIPVIGITGSNGKTVIKEWLYQLLQPENNIVRSPKSYNSQIGVPLSVWQMSQENTLGIFEAGISQPGEMAKLEKIIRPTIGIFTNLGEAHQGQFHSFAEKAEEKALLFRKCFSLIYCRDYPDIENAIRQKYMSGFFRNDVILIGWTLRNGDGIQVNAASGNNESLLQVNFMGIERQLSIPFTDKASIENCIHCWLLMLHMGYDDEAIQQRMRQLHAIEMRLEIKSGINGCTIINDSYNSDLVSLSIALDTLNQQNQHEKKTLILSDILESGKPDEELYAQVSELLKSKGVNKLIGIGNAISSESDKFRLEQYFYPSTEAFLKEHNMDSFDDEAILIKGSRKFGFEQIAARLQQKTHQTELRINLTALINNLNVYRSLLKPEVKVMAMVKAFSYGSGSYEIANVLQFHKVDYLAVAYADEGVYLREKGIRLPIMIMNPEDSAFEQMIRYELEPEIYSFRILNELKKVLARHERTHDFPVHIKVDTGMHRLGFDDSETEGLVQELLDTPAIKVRSIFSHLASADVPGHDEFTHLQLKRFDIVSQRLSEALGYPVLKHVLNSPGIARFPNAQYDMVRLGIGLYGIDPTESVQNKLEEVSSLVTHISQIKHVNAGETVGYSRKGEVRKDSRIATLGIGYADGIPRAFGNGKGNVLINGRLAPLIGNVCMDMCMVDVSEIEANEGDVVIIFGKELPVQQMAATLGTIAYEVLTSVSQRVKRVYFKE